MPQQVAIHLRRPRRERSRIAWKPARTLVLALLLSAGTRCALRGDGGVFTSTKHGDPNTGIQRLTGPDYPRGACVQCHYQHASAEGVSTGPAYPYGLFAPNNNDLCGSAACHAGPGASRIYPGRDVYDQSIHATAPSAIWPGPTPWRRRLSDRGKCINCHDPHGYADAQGLIPTLCFAREEKLCLTCHDGSPAHTNIQADLVKTYNHPSLTISGRHSVSEGGDVSRFGSSNRHAECEDCHNTHQLRHPTAPPTAPNASLVLQGVSYIEAINGPAFTRPSYVFHAADDPVPASFEYQLCFKCHSSWTVLPLTSPSGRAASDKAKELNPNNASYHPVEAAGKQAGTVIGHSLLPPYTAASVIFCSDCHGSDSATAPRGPHGSANRYLLKRNYATDEHSETYFPSDFTLCFLCHSETALMDESDLTQNTNFRFHRKHLQGGKGNQPFSPLCMSCHGSSHGSASQRLIGFSQEPHLTSFTSWTSKEAGVGIGQCTLNCHGVLHEQKEY